MVEVYGRNRRSGVEIVVYVARNSEDAERFCEEWGWNYSDGSDEYWLFY